MKPFRFHLLVGLGIVFGCVFVIPGCEDNSTERNAGFSPDTAEAAYKTHVQYVRAVNAGTEKLSEEIPEQYWADGIKTLEPVKVYLHRHNVVVVQKLSANAEEGKYIYIPVSSYIPRSGVDDFTFTKSQGNVHDYRRSLVN